MLFAILLVAAYLVRFAAWRSVASVLTLSFLRFAARRDGPNIYGARRLSSGGGGDVTDRRTMAENRNTFKYLVRYLKGKDRRLWLAIIDYWIGELHLLRSDVEARMVPRECSRSTWEPQDASKAQQTLARSLFACGLERRLKACSNFGFSRSRALSPWSRRNSSLVVGARHRSRFA